MKPGVTCQKLVSLNKISPVTEKTHLIHINLCLHKHRYSWMILSNMIRNSQFWKYWHCVCMFLGSKVQVCLYVAHLHIYMYSWTCMRIFMFVFMYVCIYIYIYIYIHTHRVMHENETAPMYVCMYKSIYIGCMHVGKHEGMYVYIHTYRQAWVSACLTVSCIHEFTCMYIWMSTDLCMFIKSLLLCPYTHMIQIFGEDCVTKLNL